MAPTRDLPSGPGEEEAVAAEVEREVTEAEDAEMPDDLSPLESFENTESGCRAALLPAIEGAEELRLLSRAVAQSDLEELLMEDATDATLFAPTNEAFESTLESLGVTLAELAAQPEVLSALLRYHIVPGDGLSLADLRRSRSLDTALQGFALFSGSDAEIEGRASTGFFIGDAIQICQSTVYLIDAVLLPEPSLETLIETFSNALAPAPETEVSVVCREGFNAFFAISSDDSLSTLASLLNAAQLSGPLAQERVSFTVFAPTDRAFNATLARLNTTIEELQEDEETLESILKYHIIRGENWEASELPSGRVETWNTSTIVIEVDGGVVLSGIGSGASVTEADVDFSCASAVHKIDGVLLPFRPGPTPLTESPGVRRGGDGTASSSPTEQRNVSCQVGDRDLFQVLSSNPELALWSQIIQLAGMRGIFSDKSISVTMFAPNDAAFGTLLAPDAGFAELIPDEVLARVLVSYHTVGGAATSRLIEPGMKVRTLLTDDKEKQVRITIEDNPFAVIDLQIEAEASLANFVQTDIIGCNSVIHMIDTVLLPYEDFFPSETVDVMTAVTEAEAFGSLLLEANEVDDDDEEDEEDEEDSPRGSRRRSDRPAIN